MVNVHRSPPADPAARGEEFGAAHGEAVTDTLERYRELFAQLTGATVDLPAAGREALAAIGGFSPDAEAEIRGIAGGAGLEAWAVAALNARTEILGRLGVAVPGECSTVVALDGGADSPLTMQTWDWHDLFADRWLVWTIEHPDGRIVHTLTEYGMLGKVGVNSRGIGIHLNILSHRSDGGPIGVPIHVLARTVLDRAADPATAVGILGPAVTSASTVVTVVSASGAGEAAICAELAPEGPRFVSPTSRGLLAHTNHFLDAHLAAGDRAPRWGPDSYLRLDALRRALRDRRPADREELRAILSDHSGGPGSLCCHPAEGAGLGDRWATLATISLDVRRGELWVRPGGPCDPRADWHVGRAPDPVASALTDS